MAKNVQQLTTNNKKQLLRTNNSIKSPYYLRVSVLKAFQRKTAFKKAKKVTPA